jgi:hypothetical protein
MQTIAGIDASSVEATGQTAVSGHTLVPRFSESFTHDDDGSSREIVIHALTPGEDL